MQLLALAVVEKLPAAHASQTRSLVAEGACATKVPAAQLWNAAHESAFVVALKLPSLQAVQARSWVVEPAVDTHSPARHVVHETHSVAGSRS